uniref:PID domain-containing protein n=1 Tax=Anopheles dirus TaxID=7168 RepID=A0A182N9D1_9DIPT
MASTLMFWNKQNNSNSNQNGNDAKNTKNGRNWLHAPDVLVNGHVAYLVKYLGSTPVEQPKGIEVVKEAIRRLQFTQQMKKAEGGGNVKTKKVEITISVDGVAIQEPRSLTIMHQFPLHKISYCADEKGAKKFFSFIAKTGTAATTTASISSGDDTNSSNNSTISNGTEDRHECFVFISNKLASDITLTIGQAFDLAYRRYVSDSGKSLESVKLLAQKKQLEHTITAYRQRLRDLSELVSKAELEKLLLKMGLRDICDVPALENGVEGHNNYTSNNNIINSNNHNVNGNKTPDLGIDVSLPNNDDQLLIETSPKHFAPIVPPRNIQNQINNTLEALKPSVGTKLEGLLLNSDSDSDFDPRAPDTDTNLSTSGGNKISNDLFGFEPPKPASATLGQQLFGNSVNNNGHNNGFTNGNGAVTNGFGAPNSPPPILAPPPAKSAPRRTVPQTNGNSNGTSAYQDLFGSAPFNPQGNDDSAAALEDASTRALNNRTAGNVPVTGISPFAHEVNVLSKNSHHLDSMLAYGAGCNGGRTFHDAHGSSATTNTGTTTGTAANLASKLNPFAAAIRSNNPLAAVQHKAAAYDVFKNASDRERLTTNTGTVSQPTSFDAPDEGEVAHCANTTAPAAFASGTGITNQSTVTQSCEPSTGASDALFEDFALSAFNEFKRDLSINSRTVKRQSSLQQDRTHKPSLGSLKSIGGSLGDGKHGAARLRMAAGGPVLLQPETKTIKNGFFSSDDVLDTFDPLKK